MGGYSVKEPEDYLWTSAIFICKFQIVFYLYWPNNASIDSCVLRYGGSLVQQSCMSVRFNQKGDQIIALRRRLPPVLYKIHSHEPVCEFDHSAYYNSCTMKSICYAGDNDQVGL